MSTLKAFRARAYAPPRSVFSFAGEPGDCSQSPKTRGLEPRLPRRPPLHQAGGWLHQLPDSDESRQIPQRSQSRMPRSLATFFDGRFEILKRNFGFAIDARRDPLTQFPKLCNRLAD